MTHLVLVVSSTPGFTELIQIVLQDDGRYDPACVSTAEQGVAAAQHNRFAVGILDSDVRDIALAEVVASLRQLNSGIRLVVIPPNNDQAHPSLAGLEIDAFLTKPFYIPDLVRTLDKLVKPPKESELPPPPRMVVKADAPASDIRKPASEPVPDWLQDVNRAAQHLTRLSLESAAQAALIVRSGKLWAYAGDLPQAAAQELAEQLSRYWDGPREGQSDLARFVHLQSTDSDYMLYATSLAGKTALALAFNAATPFTKMRAQAASLARALASASSAVTPSERPSPAQTEALPPASHGADLPPLPPDEEPIPLLDLGDVPPPIPYRGKKPAGGRPTVPVVMETDAVEESVAFPTSSPAVERLSPAFDADSLPEALAPDAVTPVAPPMANEWIPAAQEHAVQRPVAVAVETSRRLDTRPLRLEPPSPTVCSLSFACVLVPRLPTHHLVGEVADSLPELVRQACLAFGWRLEHIAVRPDYLQWLVNVPPSTSASYLMRILRHQLSERLFGKFPLLAKDNPSNDFWAPGYLIMSSHQLPPPNIVSEFVMNTRRYQGA
ncbi:MAG: transposase [Chloroflexota bacterium]